MTEKFNSEDCESLVTNIKKFLKDTKSFIFMIFSPPEFLLIKRMEKNKSQFCKQGKCDHNICQFYNYLNISHNLMHSINNCYKEIFDNILKKSTKFDFKIFDDNLHQLISFISKEKYYISKIFNQWNQRKLIKKLWVKLDCRLTSLIISLKQTIF